MPGLQLRPTAPGGVIPTSVTTGDFNKDGFSDYVVANGGTNDLWIYLGKGDGTFQLPRIIPLGKGLAPVYVVSGSLRGNGTLDLVVAEAETSTIGVLLGNGDGTFGPETIVTLPEPPSALSLNDFNHDGKLDIAAVMTTVVDPATLGVPYLAMLAGDGTGSFAPPLITSNSGFYSTAWNLDSADVNKDGFPDLLITGPGLENSQVYLNNGDGSFKAGQIIVGNGPFTLELDGRLADMNEDGCPDAVVSDINGQVWTALGDCAGNFAAATWISTGDSNAALRLADVDGDGHLDILTAAYPGLGENNGEFYGMTAGNTLNVVLGDGKGGYSVSRNYVGPGQSYSLAAADFNGDGKADVVTANSDTDTTSVYINDSTGSFGFPQGVFAGIAGVGTINAPFSSLSFSDLNHDGKPDLFFLDVGYNGEYFTASFLNNGTARFSDPITTATGVDFTTSTIGDYRVANFSGGTHTDFVAVGQSDAFSVSSSFILFIPGNGDGTFGKSVLTSTPNAAGTMTTGDFNGDGKLDFVAVQGQGTMTLATFLGNGDGTFRSGSTLNFTDPNDGILRAYSSDFNHDGKLDVLLFTSGNGYWTTTSAVWEFDGNGDGTFQPARQLFTDFQPLALGDLNGDGSLDIARYDFFWPDGTTQTFGPAKFTNYLCQADGSFQQSSSYTPYAGVPEQVLPFSQDGDPLASSLLGDFNGDGRLEEVAFQDLNSLQYSQILSGNGDGTFTPTFDVYPTYIYGRPLYAHDLDGDGISDMVELDSGAAALHVIKGGRASNLQISLDDEVVSNSASCGYVFPNVASSSARNVTLLSSIAGVQLPSSVTILASATNARFCYTLASNFDTSRVFDVNATLEGDKATAYASAGYAEDFSEAVTPTTVPVIYPGQTTAPFTVTLTAAAGFNASVALSCEGLPQGASCQFGATTLNVSAAGPTSTTVEVVTTASVAQGGSELDFNIVATGANVIRRQPATVDLASLVVYQATSAYLATSPGAASAQVSILGLPPYSLACSNLPPGVTCSFSGDTLPYPSNTNLTATLQVASGIAPGSYPFNINVTSESLTVSQANVLNIVDFALQPPASNNDWALVGLDNQVVSIPAIAYGGNFLVNLTCSLDSGGTCSGGYVIAGTTLSGGNVYVSVPSSTAPGLHQLTVVGSYQNSASQINLSHTYTFPFYIAYFSGTLSSTSVAMGAGGTSAVTATLNATAGFAASVSLACSAPVQVTCTFAPSTSPLAGGTPATVAITLAAGPTALDRQSGWPLGRRFGLPIVEFAAVFPFALLSGIRRRRFSAKLLLLMGLVILMPLASCGTGGQPGTGGGGGGGGSTPNVYTVNVTATVVGSSATRTIGAIAVSIK